MKKSIFLVLLCLCAYDTVCGAEDKELKKIIEKWDVPDEAKLADLSSPVNFWRALIENEESLHIFHKDIKKNKGAEKEALEKYASLPKFNAKYDERIVEEFQGFCDTLLINMGIDVICPNVSLHVVNDEEVNAYTVITDNGFAMCLTYGLISHKGLSYKMLLGYVSHEFAHGILEHHIRGFYNNARQSRSAKLWGGLAQGLEALSAGADAYADAVLNRSENQKRNNQERHEQNIRKIQLETEENILLSKYRFSREQEYEADLLAFRFMQFLGFPDEFIEGLKMLGNEYDYLYNNYSDHPTITSRIQLLQYAQQHPEIGNKDNAKLKEKRLKEMEKNNKDKNNKKNKNKFDDIY